MAFVDIQVHAVWGTKNRFPFLTKEVRKQVIEHIITNAKAKGIFIRSINGYTDHLHCLFSLNADMTVSKALQLLKGESAHWINKEKMTPSRFEWADEYFAASVSKYSLHRVQKYIENQESHHAKMTFEEEYNRILREYNFLQDKNN
jgi:putative transposase